MMEQYLKITKFSDIQRKAPFNNKYLVPGFFPFYNIISEFISKNITQKFFKNEKRLRDFLKGNIMKLKYNFYKEEERLLQIVSKEIFTDESDNYKFVNEIINNLQIDLLLHDYINYFLNKNNEYNEYNEYIYTSLLENIDIDSNISFIENDEKDSKEEEIDDFYIQIIKQIINLKYKDETKIIIDNKENELNKF